MNGALQRLLGGVFDYAGLFPPTQLSMPETVENFLRYRSGDEGWVVDRLVCPSSRLEELRQELTKHLIEEPVPLTVIGSTGVEWGDGLVHDAEAMTRFIERAGEQADIEAFEVRVPGCDKLEEYLHDLRSFNQVDVFCELPWGPHLPESLGLVAEQDWLGAKARTGGLDKGAFPSCDDLAAFIQQCVQLELEFKVTAGLHHPFRSDREEVGAKMHGFVNVLVAAALAQANDLSAKETAEILDCEDAEEFVFGKQSLKFRAWTADLEDVDDARALLIGIGSCSIEEPLQDLREHNL